MTGKVGTGRWRAFGLAGIVLCGLIVGPVQPAAAQAGAMIQPVDGRVTGVLSNRCGTFDGDHYGVDLAGNSGKAIGAAYPGTVTFAGWTSGGGNTVSISHTNGYSTRYLHMVQAPSVSAGQSVGQGQLLGYVGSTGNSTGPHLHFEIWRNGAVYNITPAYTCGGTVTKGTPINLPFPDLPSATAAPERFAFVNAAGVLHAKDGPYSAWQAVNSGGASKTVLSGNWIGWLESGNFYAKDGINAGWLTLAGGGQVRDIAISGDRFAFVNAAGVLYAKDGAYSPWRAMNAGGATNVVLNGNWIGWIQGGDFYAKNGIYAGWVTLAAGGQVTDIAIGSQDWFGFTGSGNFHAKQGVYAGWLTMAGGGQVRKVALGS
jgi:hypothetical protein